LKPPVEKKGYDVLHNARLNKSTAFSKDERERLGLRGLLPHSIGSLETQQQRVLANLRRKTSDIERYIFLIALLQRNETLFYRTIIDNIEEMLPLIYTPTVGQACSEFAQIFRKPKGFYITPDDRGEIRHILDNWPEDDVRVIVVTDGERILGLGDLGANGMGIPIGKLSLYVACAGIHPSQCLPVMLDVGSNNTPLRTHPLYLGYPYPRITGEDYFDLVEEFIMAVQDKYPKALIQFEDFLTPNAIALLEKYRDRVLCFNDDIQGTAAVALAGVYASTRITKVEFADQTIMFLGAGSAATGIGDLMVSAFIEKGLNEEEARRRLWFVDVDGLVVAGRPNLMPHNKPYAHKHERLDFIDAIRKIRPQVLIGATGAPGAFRREVIKAMCSVSERPVIFALSNPTSRAECTAEQVYDWSKGRAIFASGSPFAPVIYGGKTFRSGQGNNAYIFPGVGLGAAICSASRLIDEMFLVAAKTLANSVTQNDLDMGALYPPLANIREISLRIATVVAGKAYELKLAREPKPAGDLKQYIAAQMYDPHY
jgi:malate dehydrogenase (oxaloacetate-decarboxylating)(NADP+)